MSKTRAILLKGPKVAAHKAAQFVTTRIFSCLVDLNPSAFGRLVDWGNPEAKEFFKHRASDYETRKCVTWLQRSLISEQRLKNSKKEFMNEWRGKQPAAENLRS